MKRLIFLMLPLLFMAGCAVGAALPAEPEGAAPRFLGLAQSPRRSGRAAVSQASPLHGLGPMDADFGKRC